MKIVKKVLKIFQLINQEIVKLKYLQVYLKEIILMNQIIDIIILNFILNSMNLKSNNKFFLKDKI